MSHRHHYDCDICCNRIGKDGDDGVGVFFTDGGTAGAFEYRRPDVTQIHICNPCITQIVRLRAEELLRQEQL